MKNNNYMKCADRYLTEQTEVFSKERTDKIVALATEAFWAKVAELIPEATTGDFSPVDTVTFEKAADLAVRTWINYNTDGDPVM
ncbi:MAG: hypothetical protein PHF86_11800 [Candidatus Nanoarchaeia archaeon]|jgi:hypothetical protein|nr:hypothetical protein [Candidatus Nanoarchaeia archaeon]